MEFVLNRDVPGSIPIKLLQIGYTPLNTVFSYDIGFWRILTVLVFQLVNVAIAVIYSSFHTYGNETQQYKVEFVFKWVFL